MRHLVALASLALLGACATAPATDAARIAPGSRYVAMGSSFAAGAGIGPTRAGTPERCQRATINYASLLAERLDLQLDDQSCGGATTGHVLNPWDELPAQIDAITPDTRLVTVTIGGNDLNYIGRLFMASCAARGLAERFGVDECPPVTAPSAADYARLAADMREIGAAVRQRAPSAALVFVQYVGLVPDSLCDDTPLTGEQAAMLRELSDRLAAITAEAAAASDAMLLPVDAMSAAHRPCSDQPWAVAFPEGYDPINGAPWHPNAVGHRAIAAALIERLEP